MSIATEEAAQKYPEPTDADDPMYKYVEAIAGYPSVKRQGYVAGRTAEITEDEVAAVLAYCMPVMLTIGNQMRITHEAFSKPRARQ